MIELNKVVYAYPGGPSIRYPDWSLSQGMHALLVGNAGTGKSTLLHLISGLLDIQRGTIEVCNYRLSALKGSDRDRFRGKHIGILFPQPLFIKEFTILDNLLFAQQLGSRQANMEKAYLLLHEFSLAGKALCRPEKLSLFELRKAAIIRAIINKPGLILADEPVLGLNERESHSILNLLEKQASSYESTLVIASRNKNLRDTFRNLLKLENA